MRSFWSRIPMLRLAFAIITGIALQIAADNFFHPQLKAICLAVVFMLTALVFLMVVANIKNVNLTYKLRLYNGIVLNIFIATFAFVLTWCYTQKYYPTNFANFLADKNVLLVQITEPPVLHDKSVTANAEVTEVNNNSGHFTTTGGLQLVFLRDSVNEQLNYGDQLLIKSRIDTTEGPKNPDEYSFKIYLAFHNINYKTFVPYSDWALMAHGKGYQLLAGIYQLRNNFLHLISHYVKDRNDFAVAAAIMLGYNDYINADIKRAYASSGAVHILSVSGLHVSIMFFLLNFLLLWMDKRGQKMIFAKAAVIIAFIWFYACLTGLSPPVLRSAMMFTLFQLGRVFIRNVNTYNVIAGSAVLLMLFSPFVIADVGFQLSYIAVFGLVYLQPKIANLIIIPFPQSPQFKKETNWIYKGVSFFQYDLNWFALKALDFFWQLIAASLAAQIATLPLCLFYFYQFPNLFLLSNIIVIPLSNLLLFAGTVLFAVGHFPCLNTAAGWLFNSLVVLLNKFIFWIDSLSFALTKGISVSVLEMALLYVLIILLCWITEERKNKLVMAALSVTLMLCTLSSFKQFSHRGQKEILVYAVPKQKAMAFLDDKTSCYTIDSALYNNQNNMLLHIYRHWWKNGITNQCVLTDSTAKPGIFSKRIAIGQLILFEGKKILLVDSLSSVNVYGSKIKLRLDVVILSGTPKASIPILKKSVDFDTVVFDSTTKPASRKRWKKDCSDLNINYWDVTTEGAYIWNLNNESP